jgi:diguanylate cyclase (GGDEF)-like protein
MKFFLDRHKTLLPRIDVIYLLTRVMTLVGIVWFVFFGESRPEDRVFLYVILGTYALQLAIFALAMKSKFDIKLAYLLAILYDIIFIPAFVYYTGGLDSSFYLLLYLTISVAAYVVTFWIGAAVTLLIVALYIVIIAPDMRLENAFDVSMRIGFLWVYFLAISYASDYLRRSERRLLKLFDTLNMRTSELEKSQAHLEMIYENTRILASILDTDGVIREVVRILSQLLQYRHFGLIFRDKSGSYYYRVRVVDGHGNYHLKAIDESRMELVRKVCEMNEPIRVKDVTRREDYEPLSSKAASVMLVPLIAHGQNNGVLAAESDEKDTFTERAIQMLSVVARSTALAMENAELHKRTEELTINDELTETYNYRYFVQKLQEEKRRAARYNLPLSLVMVDIDWFKKLNDTYGHEAGNAVLKELSKIIKRCIRDVDIFARYGGEEFVIILPQTPLAEASRIGERIREQVEAAVIDAPGGTDKLRITVSAGVSSFPENGKSQEELVSVADQALYRAKGEGRNLVCVI